MPYSLLLYECSAEIYRVAFFGVLNMGEQRVINICILPYIFTLESVIVVGLGNVLSVILVENKIFMYFLNKVFMKYLFYVYY